ncbi:MAG: N-acetyltransferase family protein [Gemmatimonadota bacterium]
MATKIRCRNPPSPFGLGPQGPRSGVGSPRRSHGYVFDEPPAIRAPGAPNGGALYLSNSLPGEATVVSAGPISPTFGMPTVMDSHFLVVPMEPRHWPKVQEIYALGLATGHASFELQAPEWKTWDQAHLKAARLVAVPVPGAGAGPESPVGWAALSPVSGRCVYGGVAEVSVYVHPGFQGRGIGRRLMEALITASEEAGIWTLQAGIFPENRGSVTLHRRGGFRVVGYRERFGQREGVWRDVLLMERRSRRVGWRMNSGSSSGESGDAHSPGG